jgi:hypothetical protein
MRNLAREQDLSLQSGERGRIVSDRRNKALERYRDVQPRVVHFVDFPHPAAREEAHDPVTVCHELPFAKCSLARTLRLRGIRPAQCFSDQRSTKLTTVDVLIQALDLVCRDPAPYPCEKFALAETSRAFWTHVRFYLVRARRPALFARTMFWLQMRVDSRKPA